MNSAFMNVIAVTYAFATNTNSWKCYLTRHQLSGIYCRLNYDLSIGSTFIEAKLQFK